jgi:hypothetical protein
MFDLIVFNATFSNISAISFEPTIYCSQGEYANNYTTYAVLQYNDMATKKLHNGKK